MKLNQAFKPEPVREAGPLIEARPGVLSQWVARHPVLAIVLVSFLALVINCYPIFFCGKSFVSPPRRFPMLHEGGPTFPGMTSAAGFDHGSDTASVLLWGVPVSFIESRAVMEHGEL